MLQVQQLILVAPEQKIGISPPCWVEADAAETSDTE
jgi:hypothetical protein